MATILRKQELELLARTKDILEEILESVEVASDRKAMKGLREGLRDMRTGKVRAYKDFVKGLRQSHELKTDAAREIEFLDRKDSV